MEVILSPLTSIVTTVAISFTEFFQNPWKPTNTGPEAPSDYLMRGIHQGAR